MVYYETKACNDAKQLDEHTMAIYRPNNQLNETGSLKKFNIQVDPVMCRHVKTDIL